MKLKSSSELNPMHLLDFSPKVNPGFKEIDPPTKNEISDYFHLVERSRIVLVLAVKYSHPLKLSVAFENCVNFELNGVVLPGK
jgi:hypothetical protein